MTYASEVLADSPVTYYKLDETSGTNAVDDSGANDGTYVDSPTFSATPRSGLPGTGVTLGTGNSTGLGRITVPTGGFAPGGGDWSFEAFIKISANLSTVWDSPIYSAQNATQFIQITAISDDQFGDGPGIMLNCTGGNLHTTGFPNDHAWHHIVVTYDSGTDVVDFYIDGVAGTGSGTISATTFTSFSSWSAIGTVTGSSNDYRGDIDEVAFYHTTLSAARVAAHFAAVATTQQLTVTNTQTPSLVATPVVTTPQALSVTQTQTASIATGIALPKTLSATQTQTPTFAKTLSSFRTLSATQTQTPRLIKAASTVTGPVVTNVSPSTGATVGGTAVTITGTGFTGAVEVLFGGVPVAFTFVNDTTITTTSPAHVSGSVHVVVVTSGGSSAPTGADAFEFLAPAPDAVTIRVVDTAGAVITNLPLARVESITRRKNQPDEAIIVFPKHAYDRDDVHVFADDSGTGELHEIQVVRNSIVRFWGPAVTAETDSSTGEVTLHCRGVDWYLWAGRYLDGQRDNELTNPSFETSTETGWTDVGALVSTVTTDDAIRGSYSLRLESITPLGDIYKEQIVSITGTGVGTFLTIVFYFKLETIGGHALDRRGLYVEARDTGVLQTNNYYPIDEATPTGEWIRAKTTIAVDPGATWDIHVRLYSPPGSILWDDGQMVAMQSISTATITGNTYEPVDVSEIVGLILAHVAAKGTDLNIDLDNPTVGVRQVKHIQWADHISWADQMAEWIDRDDCFDYSMVYTTTTRTLTLHVPQQGVDRRGDVTLTYPGNVAQHDFQEDGGGTITENTQLDQDTGDGPDREEGHHQDASLIGGLILQTIDTAPPKSEPSSLDPLARERVNRARRPALMLTLTLVDGVNVWSELLGLGDACDYDITDGWASSSGFGKIAQIVENPHRPTLEVSFAKATP